MYWKMTEEDTTIEGKSHKARVEFLTWWVWLALSPALDTTHFRQLTQQLSQCTSGQRELQPQTTFVMQPVSCVLWLLTPPLWREGCFGD